MHSLAASAPSFKQRGPQSRSRRPGELACKAWSKSGSTVRAAILGTHRARQAGVHRALTKRFATRSAVIEQPRASPWFALRAACCALAVSQWRFLVQRHLRGVAAVVAARTESTIVHRTHRAVSPGFRIMHSTAEHCTSVTLRAVRANRRSSGAPTAGRPGVLVSLRPAGPAVGAA